MSGHRILRTVLLDVDGTLIDSNDAHARAWAETLSEFGFSVAVERVRGLIGKGGDKLLAEVTGIAKDSAEGEHISKARGKRFMEHYLPHLKPFAKARELLEAFRGQGLGLVVATSASPEEAEPLLFQANIADLVEKMTNASDAEHSKPDPDIVTAALAKARCSPQEAIMLGDTPYDVQAALKANVRAVGLRCGGWNDEALAGATALYDSPAHLLSRIEKSPFRH
jgi:HAD superfamily hydrolase (TIGR01509 family)